MFLTFFTFFDDTCALRLIRDRARPYACMSVSRVCTQFHGAAYAFLLAQVCKHRLASVFTWLSIGVVGNCLIGLLIGFALQPGRVPSYPVPVSRTRENTPRPEPGVRGFGKCICWEANASQSQWSKILLNPAVGFAVGACSCVTLCCAHRFNFSRYYRGCRGAQIVARRYPAHSSTCKLSVEIVSEVPEDSFRFSSDGRLLHTLSLNRTAAWDERCSGVEGRCALSTPGSAGEKQALAMLGSPAAQRKSSSSTLHEARTLLGANAVAPIRPPRRLARSQQRAMCLPANLSTLPKYLQSWPQFWTNPGAHSHQRRSSEWIWVEQQRKRSRLLSDWDDCTCHGRCQRRVHARMCTPQTVARCASWTKDLCWCERSPSRT